MPIYEFECPTCRAEFEELVRRPADAASMRCPECGAGVTKKLSRVALSFGQAEPAGYTGTSAGDPSPCCCGGSCSLS